MHQEQCWEHFFVFNMMLTLTYHEINLEHGGTIHSVGFELLILIIIWIMSYMLYLNLNRSISLESVAMMMVELKGNQNMIYTIYQWIWAQTEPHGTSPVSLHSNKLARTPSRFVEHVCFSFACLSY